MLSVIKVARISSVVVVELLSVDISEDFILRWDIEAVVKDVVSSDGSTLSSDVLSEISSRVLDKVSDWYSNQKKKQVKK